MWLLYITWVYFMYMTVGKNRLYLWYICNNNIGLRFINGFSNVKKTIRTQLLTDIKRNFYTERIL